MHLGIKTVLAIFLWGGLLFAEPMYITFPSDVPWITRRTQHFEIIYRRGFDDFALRALKNAEKAHKILAPLFPPGPELTYIVLADFNDSTNGYSVDLPYPHIVLFAAPPEPSGTLAALDDWLFSIILHEYVHTLHLYPTKGAWSLLRALFGPIVLPLGLMPTHLHEGLATFYETRFTTRGRGRGNEFPMYRRMAVEEKKWGNDFAPLDIMDGSPSRWPGGTSAYFFGYQLYDELFRKKGTKGIYDLVDDYSSNWPYFVNGPLERVYGFDYDTAWKNIYARTTIETQKEIADIKAQGLSKLEFLTDSKFSKWDVSKLPDKEVVVFRTATPREGAYIEVYDLDAKKTLRRKNMGTSRTEGLCVGNRGTEPWVVSIESRTKENYIINYLEAWNYDRNDTVALSSDGSEWTTLNHLHLLGCSPDHTNLLAYREVGGEGSVFDFSLIDGSGRNPATRVQVHRYWRVPEGARITGLLGGKTSWIVTRRGSETQVYRWSPKKTPQLVFNTRAHLFHLRSDPKTAQIYFIADYSGRNEIVRWDSEELRLEKVASLLSGTNSFALKGNDFVASVYRHGGFDLARVEPLPSPKVVAEFTRSKKVTGKTAPRRMVASAKPMTSADDNLVELSIPRRYTPWSTLLPRTWIPSFLFVPDGLQLNVWVPGFDLSQTHYYDINGGYDIRKNGSQPYAYINYRYRFLKATQLQTNLFYLPNYVYLSSGSSFQKVWGGSIGLSSTFGFMPLKWTLSLLAQRVERFGNFTANQSIGVGLGLSYDFGYSSRPLGVSPQRGTTLSLNHSQYLKQLGSTDNYYRLTAEIKQFLANPIWDDHIFFLTVKGGFTYGTAFFNSYFQGGGEILLSQQRTYFQNRGFPYGIFITREMLNGSGEYRFPIWRVERGLGMKPVFLKNIQGRFVYDASSPKPFRYVYSSVGVEILTDWTFSYYLPAQLRVGAYHGFGPYGEPIRVVMGLDISL